MVANMKKYIIYIILIVILLVSVFFVGIKISKKQEVDGVAEYAGKGKWWDVVYIFDKERYEDKHVNYFKITYKKKGEIVKLKDIDITITSKGSIITGNVGDMDVKERINEEGFQEILFLVGTVNRKTYFQDKYKINIKSSSKSDTVNLTYQKQ